MVWIFFDLFSFNKYSIFTYGPVCIFFLYSMIIDQFETREGGGVLQQQTSLW